MVIPFAAVDELVNWPNAYEWHELLGEQDLGWSWPREKWQARRVIEEMDVLHRDAFGRQIQEHRPVSWFHGQMSVEAVGGWL